MRFAAIFVVLLAASASGNIINDIFGDVIQKNVALFKEIVAQVQSGANPIDVIKNVITKFPQTFDNFDLIDKACGSSIAQTLPPAKIACAFIQKYHDQIHQLIGKKDRGILGDSIQKAVDTFHEIAERLQKGESPLAIIQAAIKKFPEAFQNLNVLKSICDSPLLKQNQIAVKACGFLLEQEQKIKDLVSQLFGKQKGIFNDIFGGLIEKQLALIKEIEAQIKSGAKPLDIIKNALTKFPQTFENFDLIDKACGAPAVQSFGFAKTACEFIQKYHALFHQIIGGKTVPQTRGIFSEVFDNFIQNQVAFFKQIVDRVQKGDSPLAIIKDVVSKFPDTFKNFDLVKTVCENPNVLKVDFAVQACKFIQAQQAKFEEVISQVLGKRGLFNDIWEDLISEPLAFFKEIEAQIKRGESPVTIIKNVVGKFPELVKKFDVVKAVCSNPTVQNIGLANLACKFIQENKGEIEKAINDAIAPEKEAIKEAIDEFKNEHASQIKALLDIYNQILSGKPVQDVVQQIVSKYTKDIPAIKAVCAYPLAQKISFVAEACKFLGAHTQFINKRCGEEIVEQRGIVSDILTQYKDQIAIIKNIADKLKAGTSPGAIIKDFVQAQLKELPIIKEICANPIASQFDFIQQGCAFIQANKNTLNRSFLIDCTGEEAVAEAA